MRSRARAPDVLAELAGWDAALARIRARDWDGAEAALAALHPAQPQRRLYALYLERIARWRAQPPDAGWEGVTTFDTK